MTAGTGDGGRGWANPWRVAGWSAAGLLLLTPLVAMRFTEEVDWDGFDFAFMGVLVGSVGLGLELAVRRTGSAAYRAGAAIALALGFLLVWLNGAVGIIGSEREAANLPYAGVLLVALLGALAAGFRPAGMARAMAAAALAQMLVPVAALLWGLAPAGLVLSPEVPVLTAGFSALWLLSAWLFRRAAPAAVG